MGLRAIRRRVAKTAAAVFAAVMTICATVAGQKPAKADKNSCQSQVKITRTVSDAHAAGAMALLILDPNGAVVAGADIVLAESIEGPHTSEPNVETARRKTTSDEGRVVFSGLAPGYYDVKVEARGFNTYMVQQLRLASKEFIAIDLTLEVAHGELVGILMSGPELIEKPSGLMIITGDMVRKLPY